MIFFSGLTPFIRKSTRHFWNVHDRLTTWCRFDKMSITWIVAKINCRSKKLGKIQSSASAMQGFSVIEEHAHLNRGIRVHLRAAKSVCVWSLKQRTRENSQILKYKPEVELRGTDLKPEPLCCCGNCEELVKDEGAGWEYLSDEVVWLIVAWLQQQTCGSYASGLSSQVLNCS